VPDHKKIAVYSILKDEERLVSRWYESAKLADAIYVLDTGSDDTSPEMLDDLKQYDNNLYLFSATFLPFRFDQARNFLLAQIPESFDYVLFMDLDEELEEFWYEKLQEFLAENPNADGVNLRMIFSEDADGVPIYTYNRLMLHRPSKYTWRYPAHEILVPTCGVLEEHCDVKVYHRPDETKARSYLDLLKLGYEEYRDDRSAYYYARELFEAKDYAQAHDVGYVAYNLQQDQLQRSESAALIGYCLEESGDLLQAKAWFVRGCTDAPDIRESWYHAASFCFRRGLYWASLGFVECMLEVQNKPYHSIIRYDNLYAEYPHHLKALSFEQLGLKDEAKQAIQQAFSINSTNKAMLLDLIRIQDIPITTVSIGEKEC
jgi:glycosyltransferase involved in cell wall biosynthesis